MDIKKCTIIYFSPTDTTKKILYSIVRELNFSDVDVINLNKYDRYKNENIIIDSDIILMNNDYDLTVKPNLIKYYIAKLVNKFYKRIPQKSGNLFTKPPLLNKNLCTKCGICVAGCPMKAINTDENLSIDTTKCIRCFRCVKECPMKARKIDYRFPHPLVSIFEKIGKTYREINIRI